LKDPTIPEIYGGEIEIRYIGTIPEAIPT